MTDIHQGPTPLAKDDIFFHLHAQTDWGRHQRQGPIVIRRGDGARVVDEHGKAYIEGMSGLWCASLGFSNERLAQAAHRQMMSLPYYHTFNHRVPDVTAQLARKVASLAPLDAPRVFFAGSGSEANDSMVKMAWSYFRAIGQPARRKLIAHQRGYHGSTVMGASLSGLPSMHAAFGLPLDCVRHVECPHFYRQAHDGETQEQFVARLAAQLEALIVAEGPETIAAFIAEPVLGAGGVIVPPPNYLAEIEKVLRRHGILMLADEVICGFGRTGQWFGVQHEGIRPDMMSCAKSLSAGYMPISAVVVSGRIHEALAQDAGRTGVFGHGFTHSGNPVGAAVALEAIRIYEELGVPALPRELGTHLHRGLAEIARHPLVGDVRGRGMLAGIELVRDKRTKAPFDAQESMGARVEARARHHGIIVRTMGDTIALSPPYTMSHEEIDELVASLGRALDDVWAAQACAPARPIPA